MKRAARKRRAARHDTSSRDLVERDELSERSSSVSLVNDHVRDIAASIIEGDVSQLDNWARLQGLLAMLALPPLRRDDGQMWRVVVEVEIAKGKWAPVETLSIDDKGLTFTWGRNGSTVEYKFPGESCPPWRTV